MRDKHFFKIQSSIEKYVSPSLKSYTCSFSLIYFWAQIHILPTWSFEVCSFLCMMLQFSSCCLFICSCRIFDLFDPMFLTGYSHILRQNLQSSLFSTQTTKRWDKTFTHTKNTLKKILFKKDLFSIHFKGENNLKSIRWEIFISMQSDRQEKKVSRSKSGNASTVNFVLLPVDVNISPWHFVFSAFGFPFIYNVYAQST